MNKDYKRSRRKIITIIIIGIAVPVILLAVAIVLMFHMAQPVKSPSPDDIAQEVRPKVVSVESDVLFFGNAFWGRYINDWSMASPLKEAYPFSRLGEFERDKYNAWFAGLECPTVAGDTMSSAEMDQTLSFNCPPEYLPEAKKWFTGFSLSNNHTDNRGVEGFEETKQRLDEHGIQYFGHYDPDLEGEVCEVIALPVTATYDNGTKENDFIPVAMCGYHMVFKLAPEESLRVMQEYSKFMPVIAFPHMGKEYQSEPDSLKTQVHRSMIDYGADVVLGDHPHWIQTTEAYKGRLIVHSMGNFMFDQQDTAEVTRSAAIHMRLDADGEEIGEWLEIGEKCKSYQDSCLDTIKNQNLKRIPFKYTFSVVGTDDSNKLVKPASEQLRNSILNRLRWQQTKSQLQAPYEAL